MTAAAAEEVTEFMCAVSVRDLRADWQCVLWRPALRSVRPAHSPPRPQPPQHTRWRFQVTHQSRHSALWSSPDDACSRTNPDSRQRHHRSGDDHTQLPRWAVAGPLPHLARTRTPICTRWCTEGGGVSERIGTTEARQEGFYRVIPGRPPEIAYWGGSPVDAKAARDVAIGPTGELRVIKF